MRIGWYIHHHGRGHLQRFLAARDQWGEVTGLSSLPRPAGVAPADWLRLDPDAPLESEADADVRAGGLLHWAPLGPGGYRERMGALADWVRSERPAAIVVDVSVEVALLARLLGVRVVWIAQRGVRDDAAHGLAYAAASAVLLPWTKALDAYEPGAPPVATSRHIGALSRFDGRPASPSTGADGSVPRRVLVLTGFGGHALSLTDVEAAAVATPGWFWDVAGVPGASAHPSVAVHPPEVDIWALLARSGVVVATASANAVAEVAAARRPLICLPQRRPFDEQHQQARVLVRAGLAEASDAWPEAGAWPALLGRALQRPPAAWDQLHDGRAGRRLAEALEEVACA